MLTLVRVLLWGSWVQSTHHTAYCVTCSCRQRDKIRHILP